MTLLLWLLLIAGVTLWVRAHVEARVQLHRQSLLMRLPTGLETHVDVRSKVMTRLEADPSLAVPIHQTMNVRLPERLSAHAQVQTTVPVHTQFRYQAEIPIDTEVSMDVPVVSWLPAMAIKLPIRVKIPVDMTVPIDLTVPLALDLHASGQVSQALKVPVNMTMHMKVPLREDMKAEVLSRTHSRLLGPVDPFPIEIDHALLTVPLGDLSWVQQRSAAATLPSASH